MVVLKRILKTTALSSFVVFAGCSANVQSGQIPEEGLTVSQLYYQTIQDNDAAISVEQLRDKVAAKARKAVNYSGYTRTASNETQALFKPLANPAIPIFVYPHVVAIGDEQLLKPGYTTEFFLFKQNHFAMKSEQF